MTEKIKDNSKLEEITGSKRKSLEAKTKQICSLYFLYAYINSCNLIVDDNEKKRKRMCELDVVFDIQRLQNTYNKSELMKIGGKLLNAAIKTYVKDKDERNNEYTNINFFLINLLNIDTEKYAYRSCKRKAPFVELNMTKFFNDEFNMDYCTYKRCLIELLESNTNDKVLNDVYSSDIFQKFDTFFDSDFREKVHEYSKKTYAIDKFKNDTFLKTFKPKVLPTTKIFRKIGTDYDYNTLLILNGYCNKNISISGNL